MDFFGVLVSLSKKTFFNKKSSFFSKARFVPLAYTIKKLQITCVVEDDKVTNSILSSPDFHKIIYLGWYGYSRRTYNGISRSCSIS
jgi:hypothetical protein